METGNAPQVITGDLETAKAETVSLSIWCLLVVTLASLALNWQFLSHAGLPEVLKMNDVRGILSGYHKTPNLLTDSARWWSGSWIQHDTACFRPLSSYLLWMESWLGLAHGFVYVGWIGMLLFIIDCWLCTAIAWRFTNSRICALLTAALAPSLRFWNWGGSQPAHWLAWFPVHHDLLMIGFLLGALLSFDIWLARGDNKYLALTWAGLICGALSKEFVYILPLMLGVLALTREVAAVELRRRAIIYVAVMLAVIFCLFYYRSLVVGGTYNPPPLKAAYLVSRPLIFWFSAFYKYALSGTYWFIGLALVLFLCAAVLIKAKHSRFNQYLSRPFAWLPVSLLLGAVFCSYCFLAYSSPVDVLWLLFDGANAVGRLRELGQMVFTFYVLYLCWKYRKQEPVFAALALVVLAYVPVFTFLGWHYMLAGWFLRCAVLWPVVTRLVWRDVQGLAKLPPTISAIARRAQYQT